MRPWALEVGWLGFLLWQGNNFPAHILAAGAPIGVVWGGRWGLRKKMGGWVGGFEPGKEMPPAPTRESMAPPQGPLLSLLCPLPPCNATPHHRLMWTAGALSCHPPVPSLTSFHGQSIRVTSISPSTRMADTRLAVSLQPVDTGPCFQDFF